MKVFVTGGTGVLGRPTIERLVAAGHSVRGLAHHDSAIERLRALGAEPVRGDLFEPESLRRAMAGCEAVLHLATRIPPVSKMGRLSAWAENDRLRRDGTRLLVDAALAAGVEALVYESIVLVYASAGDQWIDAQTGRLDPPPHVRSTVDAEREVRRFTDSGGRGIALRLGLLYSPGDATSTAQLAMARKGYAAIFGPRDAYWPALWVDDAAEAIVAATLHAPAGVFDVVDDRPLTRAELHIAMSQAVGRRLWRLPRFAEGLILWQTTESMQRSLRVSNRRFKELTGWHPAVSNVFEAWQRIVAASTARAPDSSARQTAHTGR